jgi:hypothetical protein
MSYQNNRLGIYPVTSVPVGDDKKLRPFHVLRCMGQPPCKAELLISPGNARRLPIHAIMKQASHKGWLADRRGYCLCPDHTPWAKRGGEPSDMAPNQKRAAYCAIRDRHMSAAANDPEPKEVRAAAAEPLYDEVIAAAITDGRMTEPRLNVLGALIPFIRRGEFTKGWRRRAAESIGMNETTFSGHVHRLIRLGYLAPIPGTYKLIVRKQTTTKEIDMQPDPPPRQPEPMPEPEPAAADVVAIEVPVEAPRQPTLEDNRRIRRFLDENYDEDDGRWCGDLNDETAARRLNVPRAWVATIRGSFYGDDVNEASARRTARAAELVEEAAKLRADAIALAERAEDLERRAAELL